MSVCARAHILAGTSCLSVPQIKKEELQSMCQMDGDELAAFGFEIEKRAMKFDLGRGKISKHLVRIKSNAIFIFVARLCLLIPKILPES